MTTVTIIVPDNIVLVGGKPHTVDCSTLVAENIHAVQWDGSAGWVEYAMVNGEKTPNAAITGISPYQSYIDAWTAVENYVPPPPPSPTTSDLIAYANRRQWQKATSGYTATINGSQVTIPTTSESMSLITGKVARFQQANPPASVQWQTGATTFITIAEADFMTLAVSIADFIQSTFDKLATVIASIQGGTITTTAQIDQQFT
jgi:hypothetical protein